MDAAPIKAALRGSFDRVELDDKGRAVVVDFKTGKTPAKNTAPQPTSAQAIEQIARETADRVAREVTAQLTRSLSRLEKETKRARKAASRAASAAAAFDPRRPGGKKGKKTKKS